MVIRVPDWPTALGMFVAEKSREPFAWGSNDCALFAADAVRALVGVDLGAKIRGKYKTARGAASVLRKHGGMMAAVDKATAGLGAIVIAPAFAQRGDIALAQSALGLTVLVRVADAWIGPGRDGIERHLAAPLKAWAIGRSA